MRIGIFGDSYCATDAPGTWIDQLRKLNPDSNIDCYGKSGVPFYHTYKRIVDFAPTYDQIIVCVTHPGRIIVNEDLFFAGVGDAEGKMQYYKREYKLAEYNVASAAKEYYLHLQNTEYDADMHQLMVTDIYNNHTTTFIPCFKESGIMNRAFTLYDVYRKENAHYGLPDVMHFDIVDRRKNHLTNSSQRVLAQYINDMLHYKSSIITLDDFLKDPDPYEEYFK